MFVRCQDTGASQAATVVKNLSANAGDTGGVGLRPWVRKIPWGRKRQPTPVFLPGKPCGQKSPEGYCLWGCKEDATERLSAPVHTKMQTQGPLAWVEGQN